jgi:hypothetical protein
VSELSDAAQKRKAIDDAGGPPALAFVHHFHMERERVCALPN